MDSDHPQYIGYNHQPTKDFFFAFITCSKNRGRADVSETLCVEFMHLSAGDPCLSHGTRGWNCPMSGIPMGFKALCRWQNPSVDILWIVITCDNSENPARRTYQL